MFCQEGRRHPAAPGYSRLLQQRITYSPELVEQSCSGACRRSCCTARQSRAEGLGTLEHWVGHPSHAVPNVLQDRGSSTQSLLLQRSGQRNGHLRPQPLQRAQPSWLKPSGTPISSRQCAHSALSLIPRHHPEASARNSPSATLKPGRHLHALCGTARADGSLTPEMHLDHRTMQLLPLCYPALSPGRVTGKHRGPRDVPECLKMATLTPQIPAVH